MFNIRAIDLEILQLDDSGGVGAVSKVEYAIDPPPNLIGSQAADSPSQSDHWREALKKFFAEWDWQFRRVTKSYVPGRIIAHLDHKVEVIANGMVDVWGPASSLLLRCRKTYALAPPPIDVARLPTRLFLRVMPWRSRKR
jgi:hypothetical protein